MTGRAEWKKLKREVSTLWLVTVMTADGKNREQREQEMKQERNNLVKNWARPVHRQVIAKPAWGWEQKTNPPHLWEIWRTSIFMMEKKGVWLCETMWAGHAIWLSPLIQRWHFGHHQEGGFGWERGQLSPGRCHSFLLECGALHNYTTTSMHLSVWQCWRESERLWAKNM